MTVPVAVPGDLVTLRFSAQARARGAKDVIRMLASSDRGQTWREVGAINGPTPGTTRTFRVADWPAGTRNVLLRFALSGNNTIGLMSFRIDADYRDPLAAKASRRSGWSTAGAKTAGPASTASSSVYIAQLNRAYPLPAFICSTN